jgi:hypothetical protein
MTVPASTRRSDLYEGNDATTSFSFAFKVFSTSDIAVVFTETDGEISTLVEDSDYSVTLNGDQSVSPGGTITYPLSGAPLATGETLVIVGSLPYSQTLAIPGGGNFNPVALENALDRLCIQIQQLATDDGASSLHVPTGETVDAFPAAALRAGKLASFDDDGQPTVVAPSDGTAVALAIDLASGALSSDGAGKVAFNGARAYVDQTVGGRLLAIGADPRALGAPADGVSDDAAYITAALLLSNTLDLRNGTWKINSTIALPANCVVDMRGATITANTGATPLFSFTGANEGLTLIGGLITGTAASFLKAQGSTATPTLASHYARMIRLQGVHVTSTTIGIGLDFQDAVRQVYVDSGMFYTVNGINANGKCVEVMVHKTIIYSSTGAAGTYGVKLRSPSATSYYNEGWSFTDCTVDAFETAFDVEDIFVLTVHGGFVDGTAYAFDFGYPTTTHCRQITINGVVCGQKIRFAPTGGYAYSAQLVNMTFTGITGVNVQFANNAAAVAVRNCMFDGSTSGVAVEMVSNNASCVIDGIDCDSTFLNAVQVKGAIGADVSVGNINYRGAGDSIYIERPVLIKGVPASSSGVAAYARKYNTADLAAAYIVGAAISTLSVDCAKGETGYIDVALNCSGMNAATQRLDITTPAGMEIPSGTGWSSGYILPGLAAGMVVARIPYYCTADIAAGSLVITNAVGNTVTIGSHSRFGIVKDW